ncbi:DNA alkylation repair protein [Patescibacteria group bacterium]|nr:DNA alkylation repair protein [Patescibacteria group bacterium]MBU2036071.1 DNA alkylation repair protein [Patescibacteria group bacterium]
MDKTLVQNKTKGLLKKADKPREFIKGLQELFKSLIDKEATKNYLRIIPDTGKFFGVPFPILRVIATEIGKFVQKEPTEAKLLLEAIWNEGSFESRQIAGKSLEKLGSKNPKICLDFVSSVLPDLDNWAVCDNLAMCGIETIVCQNPELVLPLSEKWIKDKNKWIRRFGVVSLRGYKKIQITDKVFGILGLVMEDKDKDIKKAVSWILREITKSNSDEVTNFLTKWAKTNPNRDTIWIIKDGIKKLTNQNQKRICRQRKT